LEGCPELRTDRLLLRCWTATDRAAFADINRDAGVMEFLGHPLTRAQSDALADRIEAGFARRGFGLWAVEVVGVSPFIGFVGLSVPSFAAPFMPAVEVGWRLDPAYWGRGYATEAAHAAVAYGFDVLGLDEIVSFTVRDNARSKGVMERIGMTHDPADDFAHALVPANSPLREHVLYRIRRDARGRTAHAQPGRE
jgi:RimJ/RimL family protein N-acetyltransferase